MADVQVNVWTVDDVAIPAPIEGVSVKVFDEAGVFITSGLTGSPGEIQFTLPGTTVGIPYILRLFKEGVSFLPQPRVDILVQEVSPIDIAVPGHVGDTSAIVTLVSSTTEAVPTPIPDTTFKLYSAADSYITDLIADSLGKAEIALPAAQYIVRLLNPGWLFGTPTQTIEVLNPPPPPETNVFDFFASQPAIPQSSDPNLCLMSGYLVDVTMRPLKNVRFRVMPIMTEPDLKMSGFTGPGDPSVLVRKQIFNEALFETDETGYVEVLLPRKSCYDVHIHGYETPGVPQYAQIYVPDSSGAKLEDVLFPYTVSLTFDPQSLTLAVGESSSATPAIIGSNTQVLSNQYAAQFMDFTIVDPTIAGMAIGANGAIAVTGLAAGTTELTAVRSSTKSTYVPRCPDIPALAVVPVIITITL
jgi:hypothetical protein